MSKQALIAVGFGVALVGYALVVSGIVTLAPETFGLPKGAKLSTLDALIPGRAGGAGIVGDAATSIGGAATRRGPKGHTAPGTGGGQGRRVQ